MTERKKYQHYVPKFYLEGFQNSSEKLWCYDKQLDKAYEGSAKRLGGEKFYYDVPDVEKDVGTLQFIENWFHPMERDASSALTAWRDRLENKRVFAPTEEEQHAMAVFMAVQSLRTPRARKEAEEAALLAAKISFFNYLGETHPEVARKLENPLEDLQLSLNEERRAAVHAMMLLDLQLIEELAVILCGHLWIVSENQTCNTFYTSDHPLVVVPHVKHPVRSMSGLRSPGVQVLLPLTPRHSLSLLERSYWQKLSEHDRKLIPFGLTKEHVDFENSHQVVESTRFVYSHDGDFSLAREMCRDHPRLRDPERPIMATRRLNTPRD
jgi:hypothetical protein